MSDSEWAGEPHTLIVTSVRLPDGPFDSGSLDYELEHPSSCKEETCGEGDDAYVQWACELGWQEQEGGLAECLRYSGTPVTQPGTYRVQSRGRKYYVWDCAAYEYDGGIVLMEPEVA